jgi:hypothetical protein
VNTLGQVASWLALFAAAWNTGRFVARWNDPRPFARSGDEQAGLFACAVFTALAWALLGGALLRQDAALGIVARWLVIDAGAGARLATMVVAPEGAVLTVALIVAFAGLLQAGADGRDALLRTRRHALASGIVMLLLAVVTVRFPPFAPAAAVAADSPPSVAAHLVHPGAALRALLFVASLGAGAVALIAMAARRSARTRTGNDQFVRRSVAGAWALASLSLGADQWARTALDATPGMAGARNATGIVWWLLLGALFHERVRARLLGGDAVPSTTPPRARRAAYAGALLILLAFGAHVLAARADVTLAPGRATEVRDVLRRTWRLVHQGLSRFDTERHDAVALAIEVTDPDGKKHLMTPELRAYHDRRGEPGAPVSVRAVRAGALQELLLTIESADESERARVRVAFIPFTWLWMPGLLLLIAGTMSEVARSEAAPRPGESAPDAREPLEAIVRQAGESPVSCPQCGVRPEPDARYCSNCARFLIACPACGRVADELAPRFCSECGTPLAPFQPLESSATARTG